MPPPEEKEFHCKFTVSLIVHNNRLGELKSALVPITFKHEGLFMVFVQPLPEYIHVKVRD